MAAILDSILGILGLLLRMGKVFEYFSCHCCLVEFFCLKINERSVCFFKKWNSTWKTFVLSCVWAGDQIESFSWLPASSIMNCLSTSVRECHWSWLHLKQGQIWVLPAVGMKSPLFSEPSIWWVCCVKYVCVCFPFHLSQSISNTEGDVGTDNGMTLRPKTQSE